MFRYKINKFIIYSNNYMLPIIFISIILPTVITAFITNNPYAATNAGTISGIIVSIYMLYIMKCYNNYQMIVNKFKGK